jgi:polar amino acid transport system permease protein
MDSLIQNFFNIDVVVKYWPMILRGLINTVRLSVIAVPMGIVGGIFMAILTTKRGALYQRAAILFVDVFRALPPLVLLILVFYGLPHVGLQLSPYLSAVIVLFVNTSAFYGEIFRAGFLSVPAGQTDAARATGLTFMQSMAYVLLPQAVRNVMPDLVTNTLEVVKLTSIAAVVTYTELTQAARISQGLSFNATPIFLAAFLYFIMLWPLVRVISRLERRVLS